MRLSVLSIRKPIATAMVFVAIGLLGLVAFVRTGVDLLPTIAIPRVVISTTLRDATPEEIETLITAHIEAGVSTLHGIKTTQSVSREGLSVIIVEYIWGTNMDIAILALREKLDNVRFVLPKEAGRPTISRIDPTSQPIMTLALTYNEKSINQNDTARTPAQPQASMPLSISNQRLTYIDQSSDSTDINRLINLKEAGRLIFKRRLEQVAGIAQAVLTGGLEREILIEFDALKLLKYGVSLDAAGQALKSANMSIPAGSIMQDQSKYALRVLGEFRSLDDIRATVIQRTSNEGILLLSDIATVRSSCKERLGLTRLDGVEAIGIHLYKDPSSNTVEIAERVRAIKDTLDKEYSGFHLAVVSDNSTFISAAISAVQQEIFYGGILAVLVLFVFLRSLRNIGIIAITIPVSLLITCLLMYIADMSFNVISLSGIAVGIGLLLDGSIVVIESIARKHEQGLSLRVAALHGIQEVGVPIIAGTMTTIVVFLPPVFLKGIAGEIFRDQSFAIIFSLLASLIATLTLIPMLAARSYRNTPIDSATTQHSFVTQKIIGIRNRFIEPIFRSAEMIVARCIGIYERLLTRALDYPRTTLMGTALLMILTVGIILIIKKEFIPPAEQEDFLVMLEFPAGTSPALSALRVQGIESALLAMPEIEHCVADIGIVNELMIAQQTRSTAAPVQLRVKLHTAYDYTKAEHAIHTIMQAMPDIRFHIRLPENTFSTLFSPTENDIVVRVQHQDIHQAFISAQTVVQQAKEQSQIFSSVFVATDKSQPEYRVTINRESCLRYGIQAIDVARSITGLTKGVLATTMNEFDQKIDIRMKPVIDRSVESNIATPHPIVADQTSLTIEELFRQYISVPSLAKTAQGASALGSALPQSASPSHGLISLPIAAVAVWEKTENFYEIRHQDGLRTIRVVAERQPDITIDQAMNTMQEIIRKQPTLPQQKIIIGGVQSDIQESFSVLYIALAVSVLLMFTVLTIEFESVIIPFVVLLSVPLGLIGAMFTLYVAGESLNVVSLIGLVILVGIADNDAVVKIETILAKRRLGLPIREAIIAAGHERFRPIVMNSLTVMIGLIPMMIGTGAATQLRNSLSLAVVGGLLTSTGLTLVVIPVLYTYAEKIQQYFSSNTLHDNT
jgi:hydrophobic/amphiphilic exporter-1 (mainly G- bacteria), HAE1 family